MWRNRIIYIDWMKVIGMYFIILGHLFPVYDEYIYAFNVPLFFLISGLLFKKDNNKSFFKKLVKDLIIPLILICIINGIFDFVILYIENNLTLDYIYMRFYACMIGEGGGDYGGLRSCWFIYTLILIKLLSHYFPQKRTRFAIFIVCILLTLLVTRMGLYIRNAYANVIISYPFFYIGTLLKPHVKRMEYKNLTLDVFSCILGLIIIKISADANGDVWMYLTSYGRHYILFWFGVMGGVIFVYSISKLLSRFFKPHFVITLSTGMIVILGFHQIFLYFFNLSGITYLFVQAIFSLFVLMSFYPIIKFVSRFFPLLIGRK